MTMTPRNIQACQRRLRVLSHTTTAVNTTMTSTSRGPIRKKLATGIIFAATTISILQHCLAARTRNGLSPHITRPSRCCQARQPARNPHSADTETIPITAQGPAWYLPRQTHFPIGLSGTGSAERPRLWAAAIVFYTLRVGSKIYFSVNQAARRPQ